MLADIEPLEVSCRRYDPSGPPPDPTPGRSAFLACLWRAALQDAFGSREGLEFHLVTVSTPRLGAVLSLPLVRHVSNRLTWLEPLDFGVTDYNGPAVHPEADPALCQRAWRALVAALPPADVLRIDNMPLDEAGNPALTSRWVQPARLSGWATSLQGDWETVETRFSTSHRQKLRRLSRRLDRTAGCGFRMLTDPQEALDALSFLDRHQANRLQATQRTCRISEPSYARFYRTLVAKGVSRGFCAMGELTIEGERAGVVLGIADGGAFHYLRKGVDYERFAPWSAGILLLYRTMKHAHGLGLVSFDFTIGDYPFKQRFGAQERLLGDLVLPLSAAGAGVASAAMIRSRLRRLPVMRRIVEAVRRQAA